MATTIWIIIAVAVVAVAVWAAWRRKLVSFLASFVYSLLSLEIGRGYAEYLPESVVARLEEKRDKDESEPGDV